jgi:hypothetical protein
MRSFKHLADARHNPKFRAIERKLGEAGYARAFKLLEILSERGGTGKDFAPRLDLNFPHTDPSFLGDELGIRPSSVKITLDHFAECRFIDPDAWKQNIVYVPQMIEYLDEWTRKRQPRNSGATTEPLRSDSEVTQEKSGRKVLTQAWTAIDSEPFGSDRFRGVWEFHFAQYSKSEPLPAVLERCIEHCRKTGVQVPSQFSAAKRRIEEREVNAQW